MSKETAAPFVLLLGVSAIALSGTGLAVARRAFLHLCAGTSVGLLLLAGMNEFRYGSLLNHVYLNEPRASRSMLASNGLGMLVSPNAGIVWFWPGVALALAVLVLAVLRPPGRGAETRRIRFSVGLGLLTFVMTVWSLADWWAPFGWYAWGPRPLMPTATTIIVLSLPLIDRHVLRCTWLSPIGLAALIMISGLVVLPSVGVVFNHHAYTAQVVATWRDRPICSPAARQRQTQQDKDMCARRMTWRTTSMPLMKAVTLVSHDRQYWEVVGFGWASIVLW